MVIVTNRALRLMSGPSNGAKLVRLRDPWGIKIWRGAWSDGSPQWQASDNAGLKAELEYDFGDDGTFWMSYAVGRCRLTPGFRT